MMIMKEKEKGKIKGVIEKWRKMKNILQFLLLLTLITLPDLSRGFAYQKNDTSDGERNGIEFAGFFINGRFDINIESREFKTNPFGGKFSIVNYHHFLFVSRNEKSFFVSVQIPDLWYYEFGYIINKWVSVKGGKIMVPIGADPLFHHEYGGLTGFDQRFLPFVWSEHGVNLNIRLVRRTKFLISSDIFVVNAPKGDPKKVLLPTEKSQPDKLALGGRLKIGYGKVVGFLSLYWNQYSGKYNFIMPGADLTLSYGFLPFAKFLAVKMGFLRPYVEGDPNVIGNYYHFADYIRFDVKLPENFSFRYIAGTSTFQNYKGFFYDKETGDENDSTTHNFGLYWRKEKFTVGFQYVINLEAKEINNDFMRVLLVYEF